MTSEVQRFDIAGSPGSGKFTLSFRGAPTIQLAYHPAAGDVQSALQALPTIGAGNVLVTKDGNWGYVCTFQGALGDQALPLLEADDSQLGGSGSITVSEVIAGVPPSGPPLTQLTLPCTVTSLRRYLIEVTAMTSGAGHNAVVTSDGNNLYVSW